MPHEQPKSSQPSIERGYEPSGINNRALLFAVGIVVAVGVLIQIGVWFLNAGLFASPRAAEAPVSALPAVQSSPSPPLQPTPSNNQLPWQDLQTLRRQQNATFERMGWLIDPKTGAPIIPDDIVNKLARRSSNGPASNPAKGVSP